MAIVNKPFYLEIYAIDENNNPILNLVIEYKIYKSSNGLLIDYGNLISIGDGFYNKEIVLYELGQYRVVYLPSQNYLKQAETIIVEEEKILQSSIDLIKIQTDKISNLDNQIKRILGLVFENYRTISTVYDGDLLKEAIIKIYPTKKDLENDENALGTYKMITEYNSEGKMKTYQITKE